MFFSTAKKATDTPPGRDVGAQAGSPSKKPATTATTTGILSILVFNPTLLPEGAEKQGEQEGPFGSNTSADSAEEEDASADGLSREEREQEAKIVYSYPPNREPEERRSQAGLLEGLLMYIKYGRHEDCVCGCGLKVLAFRSPCLPLGWPEVRSVCILPFQAVRSWRAATAIDMHRQIYSSAGRSGAELLVCYGEAMLSVHAKWRHPNELKHTRSTHA